MCIDVKRNYTASIETTKGSVSFVMPAGQAPKTVNNFVVLAVNGYYNGLSFWRIEDWVVQAGDPRGNGRGGPGYSLPEEATAKEWVPGSVGMARPVGGPVNGSQFFITKDKWPGDGPGSTVYNHFGTVVVGFDILQQLTPEDRILKVEVKAG
jgi:cyclophilin family peptidyl-prolyl cis-trans isomerase